MTSWDGGDRRKNGQEDHDLLIEINTNVKNFMQAFEAHLIQDARDFEKQNLRIGYLEKVFYCCTGIIIAVEFLIKLMK